MNKSELIEAMAKEAGLTQKDTKKALDAFITVLGNELKQDGKLALIGFGSFSVVTREARTGRNPRTGETIQIPAKKMVKFQAGAELNNKIN